MIDQTTYNVDMKTHKITNLERWVITDSGERFPMWPYLEALGDQLSLNFGESNE